MANVTLRNLDDVLYEALKQRAKSENVSLNTLLLRLIGESTGMKKPRRTALHHDLDALAGTWSEADAEAFARASAGLDAIDAELWK